MPPRRDTLEADDSPIAYENGVIMQVDSRTHVTRYDDEQIAIGD